MLEFPHLLLAVLTGFASGFLVSVPVGPVNLTIVNEGARRGFFWGSLIGLGATVMETAYCAIAFAGFSTFFDNRIIKAAMELITFTLMLYLGFKFLLARYIPATSRIEERIEEKLHPHSAFMTGFVRVLGNPGVLLFWITLTATFISHDLVNNQWPAKFACIVGVGLGAGLWFFVLSYAVSLGHRKLSDKTLLRMEHVSGAFLLLVAIGMGLRIIWHLARHRIQ